MSQSTSQNGYNDDPETAQIWLQRVLPLLIAHLVDSGGTMAAYLVLHDGAATVSLLEVYCREGSRTTTYSIRILISRSAAASLQRSVSAPLLFA